MDVADEACLPESNSSSKSSPSPQSSNIILINDSESNDSSGKITVMKRPEFTAGEDSNSCTGPQKSESEKSTEEAFKLELRKLSLDQNGTFMVDFDPEKSKREMRKMNRRLYTKESKKNQLYDERGVLLETSQDICDCLDKDCPGCHFPCPRCGSEKCGTDCRCNRKYTIDFIEVEGTDTSFHFPA